MDLPPAPFQQRRLLLSVVALLIMVVVALVSFWLGRATADRTPVTSAPTLSATAFQPATTLPSSVPPSPATSTLTASLPTRAPATRTPTPRPSATAQPTRSPTPSAALPPTTLRPTDTLELQMIAAFNQLRRENNCQVMLERSPELTQAARKHSRDMAEQHFFDHRGSDASDRISRAEVAGYRGVAGTRVRENIGAGPDPAEVVAYWNNLGDVHLSQIVDCAYNDVGVGYAKGDGTPYTHYWTANFGVGSR